MTRGKHFSMIRSFHLADLFTLANAAAGMGAIFAAMRHLQTGDTRDFLIATALIPLALVFDVLDGRIARWRRKHSPMGRELDSLADIISFGVAPAAIAFAAGMQGVWDRLFLVYFVACGVSRLARFNITAEQLSEGGDRVKFFEGTPIPTSIVLVGMLAVAGADLYWGAFRIASATFHPLVLLFALSGSLMISKTLRIPKI
jgi:CDP-diacylglycerol--serine O-phosphatidyltransferase